MSTRVYVDGFNFYYRLYKNRRRSAPPGPHLKWLDLLQLSQRLAPGQDIEWIGYFTAFVKLNPLDPDQHARQRAYIEALRTIPCLEVVKGNFQKAVKVGVPRGSARATPMAFSTFEEKGSDVNLASRLVWDGARGAFDDALVLSNDSDLREAVRIVTQECGKSIHVVSPDLGVNNALKDVATTAVALDIAHLEHCQFPDTLTNAAGILISRPAAWTSAQPKEDGGLPTA